jgi:thioredoxin 1
MVKHLDGTTFQKEVLESTMPVLVDFWAEWCGPCKMVGPVVEQIANEYQGKLKVCKVNVDEASDLAGEYNVISIPTFMIFKNGVKKDTFMGALPKQALVEKVKTYISK